MSTRPSMVETPVEGGGLVAHDLIPDVPAAAPVVVAAHGITANGLSWASVAERLARRTEGSPVRFLAVDLRGRASSRRLGPPYGLQAHAADLLALAAALASPPVLLGHSMGAFVSALAAATSPERVRGAVLVDGGLGFPPPEGVDVDAQLAAILGPAMQRLGMTFDDAEAYIDYWRDHAALGPVLAGPAGETVRAYLMHDLVPGPDGGVVSSCLIDAVRADGAGVLADPEVLGAVDRACASGVPIEFLWAERGLQDEPQGLYDESRLAALEVPDAVRVTALRDVNHYTAILDERAVGKVVEALLRLLG